LQVSEEFQNAIPMQYQCNTNAIAGHPTDFNIFTSFALGRKHAATANSDSSKAKLQQLQWPRADQWQQG
jgi:hypothetical protein